MSIKTIGQSTQSNTVGLEKKIAKGSEKLIYDVLQQTQYSTPIASTIRELVTNACDSQREKEIAIEILSGKASESDYFIQREGEEYQDSNFDANYYDLDFLNLDENEVVIKYKENDEGTGFCDTIFITDYGVGIGGRRLEGILELGYSTKRNTSENFGAFGLGAKVALSTGVPFYTIETHYNGKMFKMNCYPYKTDFLVSKWEADGSIELSNGSEVYYKESSELNHTIISFGVKKHNRHAFSNAISGQLSYFDNVRFTKIWNDGVEGDIYFKNKVLLNTDTMIVSDGGNYSRPHIVIVKGDNDSVGINYGSINFRELEMEELWGNVGIKCTIRQAYMKDGQEILIQDGVEVTPSREKVIWNDNTKRYVEKQLVAAAEEATDIITEAFKDTDDFFEWIKLCTNVVYKGSDAVDKIKNADAYRQIARLVDKSALKPKFKDTGISFASPSKLLEGLRLREIKPHNGRTIREICNDWTSVDFSRLYFTSEIANNLTDRYLTSDGASVYLIQPTASELKPNEDLTVRQTIYEGVLNSPLVKQYDDVEVPEDFKEAPQFHRQKEYLSAAERRELENKTVGATLRVHHSGNHWIWDKVEPTVRTVLESETPTFYGTRNEDGHKLKLAGKILYKRSMSTNIMYNLNYNHANYPAYFVDAKPVHIEPSKTERRYKSEDAVQLIAFSDANIRYAEKNLNWKHIDEFFLTVGEDGGYVATDYVKHWITATKINSLKFVLEQKWLDCRIGKELMPEFNKLMRSLNQYCHIAGGQHVHFSSDEYKNEDQELFEKFLMDLADYQDICEQNDVSLQQQKSRELLVLDIPSVDAYHKDIYDAAITLKELFENVSDFLNNVFKSYYGNHEDALTNTRVVLEHYNKFEIDIPQVEVPDVKFNYKPFNQ